MQPYLQLVTQLDDLCSSYLGFCDDSIIFQHPGNREIQYSNVLPYLGREGKIHPKKSTTVIQQHILEMNDCRTNQGRDVIQTKSYKTEPITNFRMIMWDYHTYMNIRYKANQKRAPASEVFVQHGRKSSLRGSQYKVHYPSRGKIGLYSMPIKQTEPSKSKLLCAHHM